MPTIREHLLEALRARRPIIVFSDHSGEACAAIGRVVKIGRTHAVVELAEDELAGVPIDAITKVEEIGARGAA